MLLGLHEHAHALPLAVEIDSRSLGRIYPHPPASYQHQGQHSLITNAYALLIASLRSFFHFTTIEYLLNHTFTSRAFMPFTSAMEISSTTTTSTRLRLVIGDVLHSDIAAKIRGPLAVTHQPLLGLSVLCRILGTTTIRHTQLCQCHLRIESLY